MVKKVGNKIEQKIKSGELKESELMEEAQEMMKKMNGMPGMKRISKDVWSNGNANEWKK